MFMIASAYNAIRIYNITKEKGLDLYDVIEFIRLIVLRKKLIFNLNGGV